MFVRPHFKNKSFTKFRKGRVKGVTQPVKLNQNCIIGLQACENTKLSSSVLQAIKRVIQQSVTRKAKIHLIAFPHLGLTKKPSEVRIGKGRGSVSIFVGRVRCGDLIYQLSNVSIINGVQALKKVQQKLGIKTRILTRVQPSKNIKASILFILTY